MVTPSASDGDGGKLTRGIHYVNISSFISLRDRDDAGRAPSPASSSQRLYGLEVDLDAESRTGRERETVRPDGDGLGEDAGGHLGRRNLVLEGGVSTAAARCSPVANATPSPTEW
jgi:hypothetical protein